MRERILGFLVWVLYKALLITWKLKVYEPDYLKEQLKKKSPFILAHWHGDELALIHFAGPYRIATMASNSKDGEIMTRVLQRLGGTVTRGSSSRNAVSGFIGLMKLIKKGHSSSFAVDGPKGPYHKAKPGVLETSRKLQIPIYFGGVMCDRAWVFEKSWNKAYLPKPFATLHIVWRGPVQVPSELTPEQEQEWLSKVESELYAAKQQAQGFIAESQSH